MYLQVDFGKLRWVTKRARKMCVVVSVIYKPLSLIVDIFAISVGYYEMNINHHEFGRNVPFSTTLNMLIHHII